MATNKSDYMKQYYRTAKHKAWRKKYLKSSKYKERMKRYRQTAKYKEWQKKNQRKYVRKGMTHFRVTEKILHDLNRFRVVPNEPYYIIIKRLFDKHHNELNNTAVMK